MVIGAHSATLAPATSTTSALGMSLHGFAARSKPSIRFAAAAAGAMPIRPLLSMCGVRSATRANLPIR